MEWKSRMQNYSLLHCSRRGRGRKNTSRRKNQFRLLLWLPGSCLLFPTYIPAVNTAAWTNRKLLSQIHGGWESTDAAKKTRLKWPHSTGTPQRADLLSDRAIDQKKQSILRLFTVEIKLTFHFLQPRYFSFLPLCSFAIAVSSFHVIGIKPEFETNHKEFQRAP